VGHLEWIMKINLAVILCVMLAGCSMTKRSHQQQDKQVFAPNISTYGKVVRLRAVYVNEHYVADSILEDVSGRAAEYTIRLFDKKLITIASKPNGAILTDCIEILYNDQGIIKAKVVHGDYCIRID